MCVILKHVVVKRGVRDLRDTQAPGSMLGERHEELLLRRLTEAVAANRDHMSECICVTEEYSD